LEANATVTALQQTDTMFAEEIDTDDGSSSLSNQLRYTDKGGHRSEEKRTSSNYRRFVQSYRRDLGVHRGAAGTVAGKTQGILTFTQYRGNHSSKFVLV